LAGGALVIGLILAVLLWPSRAPRGSGGRLDPALKDPGSAHGPRPELEGPGAAAARIPRADDFLGSEACARCHAREYALWTNSTHGRAGGRPGEVPVVARFDGKPLRFRDATVTPTTNRTGELLFLIDEPGELRQVVKVDAIVGGGHLLGGGTQSFFTRHPDGTYRFLPFDFIRRENLWFAQLRRDLTWVPISLDISLHEDLANWPPRRVLGTASELSNCQNCHGSQITLQFDAAAHAYQTHFQTLRINCESCHGGARRHVELVSRPDWKKNPDLGLAALATQSKAESMATCHQCHATKDAIRDDPYLPGAPLEDYFSLKLAALIDSPFLPDGRVRRFSYQSNHEYSDCYLNGSMTCVDCHDPHAQGYRDVFGQRLPGRFDNRQCTGCHASKELAAEAHSHHPAGSPGNLCVSCHMPYLQHQGVGQHLVFMRSDHSIPIPRPAFDRALGIENACQKCHADRDPAWHQATVDEWFGRLKPHPSLVAALAQTNATRSVREAAERFLAPDARHAMAQAAGLARFIEEWVRPEATPADDEAVRRLTLLALDPDRDLQALALMALHVGYGAQADAQKIVESRLKELPADDSVRGRWAIAADQLGGMLGVQGDLAAAMACFRKGLAVQPLNEVILSHLALAEFRGGQGDAALRTLQRAIEIRPGKAALHFQLAQLYAQLQRRAEAVAALEAGLQQAPHDANARAMLQQLRGAP
jgi:hypothetical protein